MDKRDAELAVLAALLALGGWLWFSMSGRKVAAAAGSAVATGVQTITDYMRGERNNNPGNIRISATVWQGKVTGQDPAFETFATAEDGIRAMAKVLLTYFGKYQLNTIAKIVSRYAPPSENPTDAYIARVSAETGWSPTMPLNLTNADQLSRLVRAMINVEQGRVIYTAQQIQTGVARALA